jgi:aromatic ring-opening dioxygenase catalytic subunit (LigB family)
MTTSRPPVLFLSHGGGPWSYVDALKAMYARTERELRMLPGRFAARPKCVVVVSGHWIAPRFSLSTAAHPPMDYDYSGFPPHTYQISYPAPGDPELAERARWLIVAAGIEVVADPGKGFDHGRIRPARTHVPGRGHAHRDAVRESGL